MVSTDAIAMGMNLPVRRIVFSSFSKFIDNKECPLSMSEIKQISGRAGRFNRFPTGYVTCLSSQANATGLNFLRQSIHGDLDEKSVAMVGPDLEIFKSVNRALEENKLKQLDFSEFLRLFNTMTFQKPFTCVQLSEMIEITEMVEKANESKRSLSMSEIFGFSCAPVNLGLVDHVQCFLSIVNKYVSAMPIVNEFIDYKSSNIDYLETAIKCMELYQWLARHFEGKNFECDKVLLLENKSKAIERLNELLSEKSSKYLFNMKDRYAFDRDKNKDSPQRERFKPSFKSKVAPPKARYGRGPGGQLIKVEGGKSASAEGEGSSSVKSKWKGRNRKS
jgi:ATP-dependent RNA helicase SUPV3L1/SUV3